MAHLRHCLALALGLSGPLLALDPNVEANLARVETSAPVLRLLEASCAQCHDGSSRSRDKGGFDHVLDLRRLAEEAFYLVPGMPDDSDLLLVMTETDPDLRMPPADSDAYQPTADDIAALRQWIAALDKPVEAQPPPVLTELPAPARKPPSARVVFGRFHPMLVHFPLAAWWWLRSC